MPRPHAGGGFSPFGDFSSTDLTSAKKLLSKVRATISDAQAQGIPWQSVFDALRQHAPSLWQALPMRERQKFLRRLRRWYDVHRYRMPPQGAAILELGIGTGRVRAETGDLMSIRVDGQELLAEVDTRREGMSFAAATSFWRLALISRTMRPISGFCLACSGMASSGRIRSVSASLATSQAALSPPPDPKLYALRRRTARSPSIG